MLRRQCKALTQVILWTDLAEFILDRHAAEAKLQTADRRLHRTGQTADLIVVFRCDDCAGLFRVFPDQRLVCLLYTSRCV